jgi:hypothetical protein
MGASTVAGAISALRMRNAVGNRVATLPFYRQAVTVLRDFAFL